MGKRYIHSSKSMTHHHHPMKHHQRQPWRFWRYLDFVLVTVFPPRFSWMTWTSTLLLPHCRQVRIVRGATVVATPQWIQTTALSSISFPQFLQYISNSLILYYCVQIGHSFILTEREKIYNRQNRQKRGLIFGQSSFCARFGHREYGK